MKRMDKKLTAPQKSHCQEAGTSKNIFLITESVNVKNKREAQTANAPGQEQSPCLAGK